MGKGFQDAIAFVCRPDVAEPAAETACVDGHRVVAQRHVGLVVYGDECVAAGLPAFARHIVPGRDERDDGDVVIAAVVVRDGERRTRSAEAAGLRQNSHAAEKCQTAVNAYPDECFLLFFHGIFTSFPQAVSKTACRHFAYTLLHTAMRVRKSDARAHTEEVL